MTYTIQTFYPETGFYFNTNHVSENLNQLKEHATSEVFAGFKIRIINDKGEVVFEPPVLKRGKSSNATDIANMFNAPIINLEDLNNL